MTKLFILFVIFINYSVCFGQNLVPNPSFEDTVACPFSANEVNTVVGWHASRESPDYYNVCNNYTVGIPGNVAGFQFAADGDAYIGFIPFSRNGTDYREHFTCMLTNPLTIGLKYYVSFYLSHANNFSGLSCNKIGLLFSTINYNLSNSPPINNQSQFYTDSIISDTLNWVLINGSFISDSNYTHLSIGGFFTDSQTDTVYNPPATHSYYLIDKICVSVDSLTCFSSVGINELGIQKKPSVFPIPFTDKLYIKQNDNKSVKLIFYDISGRILFNESFTNSISLDTKYLTNGIYIYEISNKSGEILRGKVVKE